MALAGLPAQVHQQMPSAAIRVTTVPPGWTVFQVGVARLGEPDICSLRQTDGWVLTVSDNGFRAGTEECDTAPPFLPEVLGDAVLLQNSASTCWATR